MSPADFGERVPPAPFTIPALQLASIWYRGWNQTMKRPSRVGLLVVLLASITACGGSPSSPSGTSSPPETVAGVTLADISLVGGESTMGTVTLENAASQAGARIQLSAGDPSILVPAEISVPAGIKSATFPVT